MDNPINHDPDVLRSRLEPHYPPGLGDKGKEVAVKYLSEIDTLNHEQIAILMAFQQVMIEQQTTIVEDLAKRLKGGQEVSKIIQATYTPKKRF